MKSNFFALPRPTIFAHRGASSYAPENTLAAFHLALQQGSDAIELDVKLCAGDHAVVIHDSTVDRTTNGEGNVADLSLEALREFDAGSHFDREFRGERIPTLSEVFEAVGRETFLNIELTNYTTPKDRLPEVVASLVTQHGMQERVLFSSFNPLSLLRIKRLLPEVPVALLALPGYLGAWARSWMGQLLVDYQALHPDVSSVKESLIKRCHHRGLRVHAYTVNDPSQMKQLFALKIDGIFTDDPLLARDVLSKESLSALRS